MKLGAIGTTVSVEPTADCTDIRIPTLESIAYQRNDSFGTDIEAICLKFMEQVQAGASAAKIDAEYKLKEELTNLIKARLGLNVTLFCNGDAAATVANTYVAHSPVVREATRLFLNDDPHAKGGLALRSLPSGSSLGTVDTEKVKLTGWLSEQKLPLYINFNKLMNESEYSSAELTAIILHELGHGFMGAAMCARTVGVNLVISDVVKRLSQKSIGDPTEYVYKELSKIDGDLDKDTVDGIVNGDPVVRGVSLFRLTSGVFRTISGSKVYNDTNFEAISDSFAVRFGYGAALATGLEKLHEVTSGTEKMYEIAKAYTFIAVAGIMIWAMMSLITGVASLGAVIFTVARFELLRQLFNRGRITRSDLAYDADLDRMNRIRNDLINGLKSSSMDNGDKRAILEQIQVVDKAMMSVQNVPKPLRAFISSVMPSDARAMRSIDSQKKIESLIANDIFVSATKMGLQLA